MLNLQVYVNGQESQFDYDRDTGVITVKRITLDGEPIPPIPGEPFGCEYRTLITYETTFTPIEQITETAK